MSDWQDRVRRFQAMLGRPTAPQSPAIRRGRSCARVLLEEALETAVGLVGSAEALRVLEEIRHEVMSKRRGAGPDVVEVVDGLCDTIYVALGIAEAVGVDLDAHFDAVHDANMRKTPGEVDAHGKRGVKPPGWVDPKGRHAALLLDHAFRVGEAIEGETLESIAVHHSGETALSRAFDDVQRTVAAEDNDE